MKYRPMGSTGELISEISFGTGDNAGLMMRAEPAEQRRVFERALELGINYWDTSPAYGDTRPPQGIGLAEVNLGKRMKELHVRPFITTKVEVMPQDLDNVAAAVERSLEGSLRRLGTDWVDVLQIHNPPTLRTETNVATWVHLGPSHYLGPRGALEGLERLRRAGKVRYLGFACEEADPRAAKRLIDTGAFHMINVWYDLLNPTAGHGTAPGMNSGHDYDHLIPYAAAAGVGVATIRPLGGGALTEQAIGGSPRHPLAGGGLSRNASIYEEMVAQARPLGFLSRPGVHKVSEAAFRFVLDTPGVTTVIGGYSELAHLDEAVAVSNAVPLAAETIARVQMVWRANYGRPPDHTWRTM